MKVIQLNIERNKHLARWVPFVKAEEPDAMCLEEIMERSIPVIKRELGMEHVSFVPMARLSGFESDVEGDRWGIAVLTRKPHTLLGVHRYYGEGDDVPLYTYGDWKKYEDPAMHRSLAVVAAESEHGPVHIGCTHFTWSANGEASASQHRDLSALLARLAHYKDMILCGDFNIPRGNELYRTLTGYLTDNVPSHVETTLDQELHRKPGLMLVVDYILSTPMYAVSPARVVSGVSDHCALVADVRRSDG